MRIIKVKRRRASRAAIATVVALVVLETAGGLSAATPDPTGPLLDLFIKKGFVTQQEAEKVKAEAEAMMTNGTMSSIEAPSKWNVGRAIKNLELYGGLRLRFEDRSAEDSAGNSIDLQRFRYSVRLGLRGDLFDNFYFGVRLDTSANPRSSFLTLGTSSSSSPYQGPFGKSGDSINLGQVYLGWRPWDWLNLTVGKMPNPLYTTPMIWDSDLNPEGLAERFKYTVGQAELFATFGQFLYQGINPNNASGGLGINGLNGQNTDNIFLLAWQGGFNYQITTNTSAKIAATIYNYIGLRQSSLNSPSSLSPYYGDPYIGEGAYYLEGGNPLAPGYSGYGSSSTLPGYQSSGFPLNQVGLNHLLVLEVPFEYNFKIGQLDARLFGDVAYNLEGSQRAQDAWAAYEQVLKNAASGGGSQPLGTTPPFSPQKNDVKAYQIGLDIASQGSVRMLSGAAAHRHGWEVKTYWQHIEQYALDPNLLDSDIFEGRANLQGICLALGYGLTDNLSGTFRYAHAWRINDQLGTGGSNQDIPQMNPIDQLNLFQVDLNLNF